MLVHDIFDDAQARFTNRWSFAALKRQAPDLHAKLMEVRQLFLADPTLPVAESFARGITQAMAAMRAQPLDAPVAIALNGEMLVLLRTQPPADDDLADVANAFPGAVLATSAALGELLAALPEEDWRAIVAASKAFPGAIVGARQA